MVICSSNVNDHRLSLGREQSYLAGAASMSEAKSDPLCMSRCGKTASSFILALHIGQAVKPSSATQSDVFIDNETCAYLAGSPGPCHRRWPGRVFDHMK